MTQVQVIGELEKALRTAQSALARVDLANKRGYPLDVGHVRSAIGVSVAALDHTEVFRERARRQRRRDRERSMKFPGASLL